MREISHQLANENFFIPNWQVKHLFLGTFNPSGGTNVPYFYGRKRNRTWELLSDTFKLELNPNHPSFFNNIKQLGIACMDLITSVEVEESKIEFVLGRGYSDSKIINNKVLRNYNTRSILEVIEKNPGINVYSTWGNGPTLRDWCKEINQISNMINLVSPSMVARVPEGVEKYPYMLKNWNSKIIILKNVNKMEGNNSFNEIWEKIVAHEGNLFLLKTRKEFKYKVIDNKFLNIVDRVPYNITRSNIEYAFTNYPSVEGPGEYRNEVHGPTYVWALLNDCRIS